MRNVKRCAAQPSHAYLFFFGFFLFFLGFFFFGFFFFGFFSFFAAKVTFTGSDAMPLAITCSAY
jgi:hypothetical protein